MNPGNYTLELSKNFRTNLNNYREDWILSCSKPHFAKDTFDSTIGSLFDFSEQTKPKIVNVDSIFQLANIPLIVSLMVADSPKCQKTTDILRQSLRSLEWQNLWHTLDSQFSPEDLRRFKKLTDKTHQESTLAEINRFMRKMHESTRSTFDTQETPKLSSLGLQINSRFLAEAKALMLSLEEELEAVVPKDCITQMKMELSSIPSHFERAETQLGLQIIPNILAQSTREIKALLLEYHGKGQEEILNSPHSVPDILKLIYQVDLDNNIANLQTKELWSGSRIGAYSDPAVRLIASSLQLDLFRQSQLVDWLPIHFYMRSKLPDLYSRENDEKLTCFESLLKNTYALVIYDNICFVCRHPEGSFEDEEGRYHNDKDASLVFKDGTKVYSWHGRNVPEEIIKEPEKITIEKIDQEKNIELRTILIDRYGISRFLDDSGARVIQQDEFGTLFERAFKTDEPLRVVMVKNSTAEPDGSFKRYFLRVPPNILTAKAAIAWTFGLEEEEYEPEIQT